MRQQLFWVLATYFTNKGFLALLAFAGLIVQGLVTLSVLTLLDLAPAEANIPAPSQLPWFVGLGPATSAMGVGGVLARQFRNPASHLAPCFHRAHFLVGLNWLGIIVAGVLICTWTAGVPLLPGLFLAVGMTGCLFSAGVNLTAQRHLGQAMESSPLDKLLGLGALVIFPLLFMPVGWLTNSQLLHGLLLIGTAYAWRACQTLQGLAGARATFGNVAGRATTSFERSSNWVEWSLESFLENWKGPSPKSSLWNRVLRWRVGNPRTLPVMAVVAGSIVIAIFPWILPVISPLFRQTPTPLRLGLYPTFVLFVVCIQIAFVWRKRLTCLDVESLRPISRTVLQREWAASLASDLIPPALTAGAIATLSFQLRDEWFSASAWQGLIPDWAETTSLLVFLSGALWLACLAFTSIIVVIEQRWLGLVIAFGMFLLGGIPFGALLGRSARQLQFDSDPSAAIPLMLIPAIVSAVIVACMWRLWTRIDFDRRL